MAAIVAGCHGKVVSVTSSPRQHVESHESCSHHDYCRKCKSVTRTERRNGVSRSTTERECSYGYHYNCPGRRKVLKERWTETRTYEDGHVGQYQQSRKLQNLSECKS